MTQRKNNHRQNNQKKNDTPPGLLRKADIPDGIFVLIDEQSAFQFVSDSVTEILGYQQEAVIGLKACDLVHPDDRGEFSRCLAHTGEQTGNRKAFRFRHAEGHDIRLQLVKRSVPGNSLIKTFVLRLRHPAHRINRSVKKPEKRLMDMIDFLPDATLAINLKSEVIAWNRAMEEMTGVKAEYMLGRNNFDYVIPFCGYRRPILIDYVLHPDPQGEAELSVVREKTHLLIHELFMPYINGRGVYLWCKASPLFDNDGNMVGAIETIRDMTELKCREEDLHIKAMELNDLNTTLKVLLQQQDKDRNELEDRILSNIKLLIEPYIEKLKHHTDTTGKSYLKVIQSNLNDIISPFARKLSVHHMNLTNKEIQVAGLIKEGKTTKEISEILNISGSAVNVYRHHIRRKLGLTKKQNLNAYLSSLPGN